MNLDINSEKAEENGMRVFKEISGESTGKDMEQGHRSVVVLFCVPLFVHPSKHLHLYLMLSKKSKQKTNKQIFNENMLIFNRIQ